MNFIELQSKFAIYYACIRVHIFVHTDLTTFYMCRIFYQFESEVEVLMSDYEWLC